MFICVPVSTLYHYTTIVWLVVQTSLAKTRCVQAGFGAGCCNSLVYERFGDADHVPHDFQSSEQSVCPCTLLAKTGPFSLLAFSLRRFLRLVRLYRRERSGSVISSLGHVHFALPGQLVSLSCTADQVKLIIYQFSRYSLG